MPSISQHISPNLIFLGGTSIIYAVTDIVFSLKQNIPPSGELFYRSIIIPPPESWPIEICCILFRLGARCIARPFCGVMALLSDGFSFRSGEFIPRHPDYLWSFQGTRESFSPLIPYLGKIQSLHQINQKKFLRFFSIAVFRLWTVIWWRPLISAYLRSVTGFFDRYKW